MKKVIFTFLLGTIAILFSDTLPQCKTSEDKQKSCIETKQEFDSQLKQTLKIETQYSNGMKNGEETIYYEDGSIHSINKYKNDQLHGVRKVYYPNGKLKIETKFDRDMPMLGNFFYKNGKLKEIIETTCNSNDVCVAKISSGRDDSYSERKVVRKNNKIEWGDKQMIYYKDGSLQEIRVFDDKERLKHRQLFYTNGNLAEENDFQQDGIETKRQYNTNGDLLFTLKANFEKDEFISGECANGKKLTIAHYLRIKKAKGIAYSVCQ